MLIFAYSYIQSVKEVIPRLLVLQEQLEVFEDLTQNQQTLHSDDISHMS